MPKIRKFVSLLGLLLLALLVATPARAFDSRGGERVVIASDQTIEDDLYVGANEFVLDGVVKGDVIVAGQTITINGTVDGDLMAAGQTVIINGQIGDDARIAGAGLQLGAQASIGSDLVAAGASLEVKEGSDILGELVFAGGQALLNGEIAGDVLAGTGGLELRGSFGGDVRADVGEAEEGAPPMNMYMTNSPITLPSVRPGLTVSSNAHILGDLKYTSRAELSIPSGVVQGEVTRIQPDVTRPSTPPSATDRAVDWTLGYLRNTVTLIIFGLLLVWLTPSFMKVLSEKLRSKPAGSVGWGVIAYAAFFFGLLVILVAMIVGGLVFGFLTLHGVSASIVWSGLLTLFALILGFILVTAFLTKIIVGTALGKWLLGRLSPSLADHRFWPTVVGIAIVALLLALPFVGWLFGLLVVLAGLGALWLWGTERFAQQPA